MKPNHVWHFYRTGGFDQVQLDSGADLEHLEELDPKLWVALACPARNLEFDSRTLEAIDTDKDGRIRVPEILSAVRWTCSLLKDTDELVEGKAELALDAIRDDTPEGRALLESAREILASLGKPDARAITPEDTEDTRRIFMQARFNGDGIIPPDVAEDPALRAVIEDILKTVEPKTDLSGKPGIDADHIETFFVEAEKYENWWRQGEDRPDMFILGNETPAAAELLFSIRNKVEDYFARCRLAAFDARALSALNLQETEYLALAAKDLIIRDEEIAGFPLARVEAGRPLPLREGVNPAWAARVARLRDEIVAKLLGERASLTESDWQTIQQRFAPYESWWNSRATSPVSSLGLARIREILGYAPKNALLELIARDKECAPRFQAITDVDKLVHFHRDLHRLLVNFVSFSDFYGRRQKAIFQAGRLYLDRRSCDLCVRVEDMAKHEKTANFSRCYLAYCECVRKNTGEKMIIAAAVTDGDADNIMVGRNGIFYDRKGQDWDATVIKIIENPISIRQAFWSPYKKFLRMIEEQVSKRAAAAEAANEAKLAKAAQDVAAPEKPKAPEAPKKIDIGTVAALGVAVGGITAAFGVLMQVFFGLGIWMPLGIVGMMLAISTPSMLIAALKLRQRNLAPLLDANGWAVNAMAKINIPFGKSLTELAHLPAHARHNLLDPYAEKKTGRRVFLVILALGVIVALLWYFGARFNMLPSFMQ